MPKIILIRHAQASLAKTNYDQLSPLGFQQAALLGQYIERNAWQPGTIITGSLHRHRQTADALIKQLSQPMVLEENPDWNEFDFQNLIRGYLAMHPEKTPQTGDIKAFFSILKSSMLAWSRQELSLPTEMETWNDFSERIQRGLDHCSALDDDKPCLIITSGGAIAMLLKHILETNAQKMIDLNFQIRNTSFTEVIVKSNNALLVAFNQINHFTDAKQDALVSFA